MMHTKGPWKFTQFSSIAGCPIVAQPDPAKNSVIIAGVHGAFGGEYRAEVEANARRIVACVNALEGFDIAAIEAGVVKQLVSAAEDLVDFCNTNKIGDALWCVQELRNALALIAPSQELQEQG